MILKQELDRELIKKFNFRERRIPKIEHTHPDIYDDSHWLIYLENENPDVYINTHHLPLITIEEINNDKIIGSTVCDDSKSLDLILESIEKILKFIKEDRK